jgi:hypothetical protein
MLGPLLALSLLAAQGGPPPTFETELQAATTWLQSEVKAGRISTTDAPYFKVFTTYAIPDIPLPDAAVGPQQTLRAIAPRVLSFALNSLASPDAEAVIVLPRTISPTLYAIDIRDFGWDYDRWIAACKIDPYGQVALSPLMATDQNIKQYGSVMVRADWFIVHALDPAKQLDAGLKGEDVMYYLLIYGKTGIPKTITEFQDKWAVDKSKAEKLKVDFGTVIEKGKSAVSLGTRRLIGMRTIIGEYWETRDDANQDFVENFFSNDFEAGEAITNNARGLQVYLLFNKAGNRVDIGDTKLVVDRNDKRDVRVRTGISCMTCHPLGINPASNELADMITEGVKLRAQYNDVARRIEAFMLAGKFDATTKSANDRFARAVQAAAGVSPTSNAIALRALVDAYNNDVTLTQAAAEVGLTNDPFKNKIVATASGRLASLARYGKPVPRLFWERSNTPAQYGAYGESIFHITGRTSELKQAEVKPEEPKADEPKQTMVVFLVPVTLTDSQNQSWTQEANTSLPYVREQDIHVLVKNGIRTAWVPKSQVRIEPGKE